MKIQAKLPIEFNIESDSEIDNEMVSDIILEIFKDAIGKNGEVKRKGVWITYTNTDIDTEDIKYKTYK